MSVRYSMVNSKLLDHLTQQEKAYEKLVDELVGCLERWQNEDCPITTAIEDISRLVADQENVADAPPCTHPNMHWLPGFKGASDEPPSMEGWYCPDCDSFIPREEKDVD